MSVLSAFAFQGLDAEVLIEVGAQPPPSGSIPAIACTVSDAIVEGVLVVAVFVATSLVMSFYRGKRRALGGKTKSSRCKTPCQQMPHSSLTMGPARDRPTMPRPAGLDARFDSPSGLVRIIASTVSPGVEDSVARQQRTAPPVLALQAKPTKPVRRIKAPNGRPAMPAWVQHQCDSLVAVVSAGRAAELPQLLDAAIAQDTVPHCTADCQNQPQEIATCCLLSAVRACAANRFFGHALVAYDHMADRIGAGSRSLWSVLLYIAVEAGALNRCQAIFGQLRAWANLSGNDVVNMVRCFTRSSDGAGLDRMLAELSEMAHEVDRFAWNRALAACASEDGCLALAESLAAHKACREGMDTVGYNTLMKCYARAGMSQRCFELHEEMQKQSLPPNEVTFGILLDVCVEVGELDKAKRIFDELYQSGIHMNVVHCTSFIKGLAHARRMGDARAVLQEMARSPSSKPDLITYATLVKGYIEMGHFIDATEMLHQMSENGIQPDTVVCNNVLSGCLSHKLKASVVSRIWKELQGLGMKPTTVTLSILLNALVQHGEGLGFDVALETLEASICSEVEEVRLFVQLIQACIRASKAAKALETYAMMVHRAKRHEAEGRVPDQGLVGLSGRLVRYCNLHDAFDLGMKIQAAAAVAGMDRATLARPDSGSTKRRGILDQRAHPRRMPRNDSVRVTS